MIETSDLVGWTIGSARRNMKRQPKMCKLQVFLLLLLVANIFRFFGLLLKVPRNFQVVLYLFHILLFKGIFDFPVCLIFLFQGCRRLVGPDVASKERSLFGLLD